MVKALWEAPPLTRLSVVPPPPWPEASSEATTICPNALFQTLR